MINGVIPTIGGLGLFLLGMAVMTDGLRAMADDRLRKFLARSTRSPLKGAITGAISTAIVQSSSTTTVAAIGFVGAGLLTFPQSLGILFGANIGTTITGWLVALVGFHTFFNTIGVLAILPITKQFATLITWIVPERGNPFTGRLEPRLIHETDLAVSAVEATVRDLVCKIFGEVSSVMRGRDRRLGSSDEQIDEAIAATQQYISSVLIAPTQESLYRRQQASIHILDHLRRLIFRIRENSRIEAIRSFNALHSQTEVLAMTAERMANQSEAIDEQEIGQLHRDYQMLKQTEEEVRHENIAMAVRGECDARTAVANADAARALKRIGYHVWRIIWEQNEGYQ